MSVPMYPAAREARCQDATSFRDGITARSFSRLSGVGPLQTCGETLTSPDRLPHSLKELQESQYASGDASAGK